MIYLTQQKNRKIIFKGKLSLLIKIFDLKFKIPRQQNNKKLRLVIKFPRIKLIGKKEKTILINKLELRAKFPLAKAILTFYILSINYFFYKNRNFMQIMIAIDAI